MSGVEEVAVALPEAQGAARTSRKRSFRALAVPAVLLVGWVICTHFKLVNPYLLVKPERVVTRALMELKEGELLSQLAASLQRDLFGLVLGSAAGLVIGGVMGLSPLYDRMFAPTFHAARQVAIFAWIPLMSVWLGTGEPAKVAFIALAAFYPVVIHTHEGIRSTAREYLEVARAFRFSRLQVLRKVVVPSALPGIFAGLHLALIYAWLATIGAEYLLAPGAGVGNLMISGRESLAMDKVLLGVVLVGGIGAALNGAAAKLEAHLLRWRVSAFENGSK